MAAETGTQLVLSIDAELGTGCVPFPSYFRGAVENGSERVVR